MDTDIAVGTANKSQRKEKGRTRNPNKERSQPGKAVGTVCLLDFLLTDGSALLEVFSLSLSVAPLFVVSVRKRERGRDSLRERNKWAHMELGR